MNDGQNMYHQVKVAIAYVAVQKQGNEDGISVSLAANEAAINECTTIRAPESAQVVRHVEVGSSINDVSEVSNHICEVRTFTITIFFSGAIDVIKVNLNMILRIS